LIHQNLCPCLRCLRLVV